MDQFTFVIPTLLGVEGLTADELRRMNMQQVRAENGRVFCQGTMEDIPRLNLRLRTGERVLISLGTFPAHSFEDLFQGTKALPWEEFIPSNGAFSRQRLQPEFHPAQRAGLSVHCEKKGSGNPTGHMLPQTDASRRRCLISNSILHHEKHRFLTFWIPQAPAFTSEAIGQSG